MNNFAKLLSSKTLTDDEYHSHPAMSQSKMKILLDSPRLYYLKCIVKVIEDSPSPAMQLGNWLDLALTEPEKYEELKVKETKTTTVPNCITLEAKNKIATWVNNLNQFVFNDDFFGGVTFKQITETCTKQDKIFYDYQEIPWRLKTDFLNVKNGFFIDLKSTRCTTKEEFIKDFFKYGYYIQAYSYAVGIKTYYKLDYIPRAYYIAVSTITGEVWGFKISDEVLRLGQLEIDRGCELYKQNIITNNWSKDSQVTELFAPQWIINKIRSL